MRGSRVFSNSVTYSFVLVIMSCFHYTPDHQSYLDKSHSAGEASKDGHSSIIEAKDFINHNKTVEEAKKSGRYRAPFLAEVELIWKLREAKLEDVVELG